MSDDKKQYTGRVIFFNSGYGFIAWEIDGMPQNDLFVHWTDINMEGYKTLYKNNLVTFFLGTNNQNRPKAINVAIVPGQK